MTTFRFAASFLLAVLLHVVVTAESTSGQLFNRHGNSCGRVRPVIRPLRPCRPILCRPSKCHCVIKTPGEVCIQSKTIEILDGTDVLYCVYAAIRCDAETPVVHHDQSCGLDTGQQCSDTDCIGASSTYKPEPIVPGTIHGTNHTLRTDLANNGISEWADGIRFASGASGDIDEHGSVRIRHRSTGEDRRVDLYWVDPDGGDEFGIAIEVGDNVGGLSTAMVDSHGDFGEVVIVPMPMSFEHYRQYGLIMRDR